jgi:hypothetical protein
VPPPARPPRYLAVVRRGETEVYRILKQYLEARGLIEVVWDRRQGERRGPGPTAPAGADAERRRRDRRAAGSALSLQTIGFFLVRPGAAERPGGRGGERPGRPRADPRPPAGRIGA